MSAAAQITLTGGSRYHLLGGPSGGAARLRSKYALLWLVITVPLVPLAVFPAIVDEAGEFLGQLRPGSTFSLSSLLLLGIVILPWELSRLSPEPGARRRDCVAQRASTLPSGRRRGG